MEEWAKGREDGEQCLRHVDKIHALGRRELRRAANEA